MKILRILALSALLLPAAGFAQVKINALPNNPGAVLGTDITIDDTGTVTYSTPFSHVLTYVQGNISVQCATLPALTGAITSSGCVTTYSGILPAGSEPAHTGDATNPAGSLALTVKGVNGTLFSGLATGLVKNTTTTGVPSIATSADVIADWTGSCSSSTFLRGDGACTTPAGTGTVSATGSPASGNLAKFSGALSLTNGDLSGDVTTSGTLAATVVKLNGTSLAGLATGLVKNTTATGVPSIAAAADVVATFGTCTGVQYLAADGACHNPGAPIANLQAGNYTFVLGDANVKQVQHTSGTAHTFTIPDNGTVQFPVGSVLTLINSVGGGVVTIAITTDTLYWAPTGTIGSRSLSAVGIATIVKVTATTWFITGAGVS